MARRRAAALGLVVVAALALIIGLVTHTGVGSFQHRLAHSENLNGARLDPPSFWSLPRIAYGSVLSHCDLCNHVQPSDVKNREVQLGWLVTDEALAGLVSSNVPNRPRSAADAPLPRLAWVVQWQSSCWSRMPPAATGCTAYDIIDDANGWELDTGQAWR